mmetsp:Transcript_41930/g.115635  ORF Transcript_41930/g.115635 Transcript_41930/m.115635 type:complete len:261 (-) Transcript_41930:1208-1990(-)
MIFQPPLCWPIGVDEVPVDRSCTPWHPNAEEHVDAITARDVHDRRVGKLVMHRGCFGRESVGQGSPESHKGDGRYIVAHTCNAAEKLGHIAYDHGQASDVEQREHEADPASDVHGRWRQDRVVNLPREKKEVHRPIYPIRLCLLLATPVHEQRIDDLFLPYRSAESKIVKADAAVDNGPQHITARMFISQTNRQDAQVLAPICLGVENRPAFGILEDELEDVILFSHAFRQNCDFDRGLLHPAPEVKLAFHVLEIEARRC